METITGKIVAVTGTLENYTRTEIFRRLRTLGAIPATKVTSGTNLLIVGSKPGGNKTSLAAKYGTRKITEAEFESIAASQSQKPATYMEQNEQIPSISEQTTGGKEPMSRKNTTGNFGAAAGKIAKSADRLICQVMDDETIYICNGFLILRMTPNEYAETIQPAIHCEPGNWEIISGLKSPRAFDAETIFSNAVKELGSNDAMAAAPMTFSEKSNQYIGMYSTTGDFVALYNSAFLSAVSAPVEWRAKGPKSPAVAYLSGDPIALVLPIVKTADGISRAVKAYFVPGSATTGETESTRSAELLDLANKLEAERNAAEKEIASLQEQLQTAQQNTRELEAKNARLKSDAQQSATEMPPAQAAPDAASRIAALWAGLDGVTVTVKGAQTPTPVVWLAGAVAGHAQRIEAAGGRWSAKRGAYYFKVA